MDTFYLLYIIFLILSILIIVIGSILFYFHFNYRIDSIVKKGENMKLKKTVIACSLIITSVAAQAEYIPESNQCPDPVYLPHVDMNKYCETFYIQKELDRTVQEGNTLYKKKDQQSYGISILDYAKNEGHKFVHFDLYEKLLESKPYEANEYLKIAALHGHEKAISIHIDDLINNRQFETAFAFYLVSERLGYQSQITLDDFKKILKDNKSFSLSPAWIKLHQYNARILFKRIKENNILINDFAYMSNRDQKNLKALFLKEKSIENSLLIAETMGKYLEQNDDNLLYVDHLLIMNEYYLRAALNNSTYALNKLGDNYYKLPNVDSFYSDYNTRLTEYSDIDFYLMSMKKGNALGFEGYVKILLERGIMPREDIIPILTQFLNGEYANKTDDKHWDIGHFIAKAYHDLGMRDEAFYWAVHSMDKGTKKYNNLSKFVLQQIKQK